MYKETYQVNIITKSNLQSRMENLSSAFNNIILTFLLAISYKNSDAVNEPIALESHITELTELKEQVKHMHVWKGLRQILLKVRTISVKIN